VTRYIHTYVSTELLPAIEQHSLSYNLSKIKFIEMCICNFTYLCGFKDNAFDSICDPYIITPNHSMPWHIPLTDKAIRSIEKYLAKTSIRKGNLPMSPYTILNIFQEAVVWQMLIDDKVRYQLWPNSEQFSNSIRNASSTGRIRLDWYSYMEIPFPNVVETYFNYRSGYEKMIAQAKPKTVTMFVTADMYAKFQIIKGQLGISQNALFEKAIRQYVDHNEIRVGEILGAPKGGQPVRVTVDPKLYFEVNEKATHHFQPLNNVFFTAFYKFTETSDTRICA